jgi:plastocyanin
MLRTRLVALAGLVAIAASVQAQSTTPATIAPHLIVVKLIQQPGKMPFAFEPATFTAQFGDTLKFVQAAETMHNVHFKTMPKGAKLGSRAISPYLIAIGDSYTIVVDSKFADGTYELVCDPHDMVGMHAFLTVRGTAVAANHPK